MMSIQESSKTRVIAADDRLEDRYLLKVILENQGYEVVEAENGQQVLEAARANLPDLIISDILMPVMDGFTLLYHLGQDEKLKEVPFVFYTSNYTSKEDEQLAYSLGADRFVHKPANLEMFVQTISQLLEEYRQETRQKSNNLSELEYYTSYSHRLVAKLEDKLEALEQAYQLLQERNSEIKRTSEENARLLHQAEAALQTRNDFISVAAHELRTPLAVLKGWLQLLERDAWKAQQAQQLLEGTKVRHKLAKAVAQSRRLERLVNDMADTSAATEGILMLTLEPLNLIELIEQTLLDERLFSERHQISFIKSVEIPGLLISGDAISLKRAFGNLLDNAIKFSPQGGEIVVEVKTEATKNQALVVISDSGPGISPSERNHLFQPYSQGEKDVRRRRFGGLGVGLYVTKAIIQAHNGQLELAESQADQPGTTFITRLPLLS